MGGQSWPLLTWLSPLQALWALAHVQGHMLPSAEGPGLEPPSSFSPLSCFPPVQPSVPGPTQAQHSEGPPALG